MILSHLDGFSVASFCFLTCVDVLHVATKFINKIIPTSMTAQLFDVLVSVMLLLPNFHCWQKLEFPLGEKRSKGKVTQNWLRVVPLANESDGDEPSNSHALSGILWAICLAQ